MPKTCDALLVAAPASGQGKTTVTAALAAWHRSQGRRVRVFKTGPDFLDPMILERASGHPVYQLDLWMGGEAHCRALLHAAALESDVILVEGVMGLFDGTPSSADLAYALGLPVLAVIDGSAMAQTFGAIAHGLSTFRSGLQFAGVLANRVGGASHAQMLKDSLPAGLRWFGAMPRSAEFALPERHLGLVQAAEVAQLDERIALAAQAIGPSVEGMVSPVRFEPSPVEAAPQLLAGVRIAVARDAAFSFLYAANLDTLRSLGAELVFFSPLADAQLPDAHSLYLPGGYPELHLDTLYANQPMRAAIHAHHAAAKPIVAECGGMLALLDSLAGHDGIPVPMWGLLPGTGALQKRFVNLGMHAAQLPEGRLRGHSFHHARMDTTLSATAFTEPQRERSHAEPVFRCGRLHASFMHLYFPSNPHAVAKLFAPG
ncbi:cobyrinate a,c-diamide synthase [Rhodoferax sp.]|uniref:cobyrinate a,c-diamide synthase n=1 Tax=Rhodoferax sp. TaxID=50421 RepID=UPI0025E939F4|nr:cobyrinate a,c-diamide synthase [Rhodoferax sp.]